MKLRITEFAALFLLAVMLGFMLYAAWHNTATMDEVAHIPAGYSYALKQDMRLNPEHPPLVKLLSGIPVLFLKDVNFPEEHPSWKENVNDQWNFGFHFFYGSGNDPEKIIHVARLAPIALTLLLGWYIFLFAKELLGPGWSLLALALFVFSPNFVGHGHLVTTDIGAALGAIMTLWYFWQFLKEPSRKKLIIAGLAFGFALSLKFTTALLIPVLIAMTLAWALLSEREKIKGLGRWFLRLSAIGVIGLLFLLLVYLLVTWNYEADRQIRDADFVLKSYGFRPLVHFNLWLMEYPVLRAWGQYLYGLLMNLQRAAGGNTTYFLGEVSAAGWWYYFPIVYVLKEPIPILIMILIALVAGLSRLLWVLRQWILRKDIPNLAPMARAYFPHLSLLLFVIVYWISSVTSPLNIGVRHIFPTVPLIWILILWQVKSWTFPTVENPHQKPLPRFFHFFVAYCKSSLKVIFLFVLALWYLIEFIRITPTYLAYFNQLIGGPANGYQYVVDSNLDWGQDLKRLRDFVEKNNIKKIKVDYFGGGDARYYLGDRFEPMNRDLAPQKGWIAISATFLQGERGTPAPGFDQVCCRYRWLDQYEPVTKIGYSIFVYYIE